MKRLNLSDEEALEIVGYINKSGRYKFSDRKKWKQALNKRHKMRSTDKEQVSFRLSALRDDGKVMDIDEFCEHYGISRNDVKSYKLVSHTSIPYYNIQSKDVADTYSFDIIEKIDEYVRSVKPKKRPISFKRIPKTSIARLVFTDVHVGMDNSDSLYGGKWDKNSLEERRSAMVRKFLENTPKEVDCIQVFNLGDFMDGLDGKTVRRQHDLPQNMSNEEAFDVGLNFLLRTLEEISSNIKYNKIIWYNVCNSNHSSSFDYFVCQAFKGVALSNFHSIEIINERKFIGHFVHGNRAEILTHGKDDINLRFGFRPTLEEKGRQKIDEYIKFYNLHNYKISFHKGDSHLRVVDKTCQNFDYNSYMALSPSSNWVQTNFNAGRSGFTVAIIDEVEMSMDFEFKWDSNEIG